MNEIKDISEPGHGPSRLAEMTRHHNIRWIDDRQPSPPHVVKRHHTKPENRVKKCPGCEEPHLSGGLLCPRCRDSILNYTKQLP